MDDKPKKRNRKLSTSRKKLRFPEQWEKNKQKAERYDFYCYSILFCQILNISFQILHLFCYRYSPTFPPIRPKCEHKSKPALQCNKLTATDVYRFHKLFYSRCEKQWQDNFLLSHMKVTAVKRRRVQEVNSAYSRSKCSTKYFVRNEKKEHVQVCVKALTEILHIPKSRLQGIAKQFYETGFIKEKRGGCRLSIKNKYDVQKQNIAEFLSKLQFKESHYCRGSTERKYLPCDLSIEGLYKMYTEWSELEDKPKSSYFRYVFTTQYNIGFGVPATDVCSTCTSYKEKIKSESGNRLLYFSSLYSIFLIILLIYFDIRLYR